MASTLPPADQVDPNDNYVKQLYILCTLFPALATIATIFRFLARWLNKAYIWWDDWTALLALSLEWTAYVMVVESIHHGKGRHIELLSPNDKVQVKYWSYLFAIFYTAIPPTVKVSALLLYRRIFKSSDLFNRCVLAMLGLVSCWGIAMVCISAFGCKPISAFWLGHGRCYNEHDWVLGYGIPNIVLDVVVWAMPIPRVWDLNLSINQKISISVIFLLGLTDCALAIIRLAGSAESLGDPDTSYSWAPAMWWSIIHTSLGIVVISLPTMRILAIQAGKQISSFTRSIYSSQSSTNRASDFQKEPRDRMRDLDLSLSDDSERGLHSNMLAMALRKDSGSTITPPDGNIQVRREFTVENRRSAGSYRNGHKEEV